MANGDHDTNANPNREATVASINLLNSVPTTTINVGDLVDCQGAIGWSGCARVIEFPIPAPIGCVWVRETLPLNTYEGFEPFVAAWPLTKLAPAK